MAQPRMRCYYEVIGVERTADENEIRKAYRKMALKLHPDKNPDDPDAVDRFKELQNAHQVLSDPNERDWYDGHREQILTGDRDASCAPDELDLMSFFQPRQWRNFEDDSDDGFYVVIQRMFDQIVVEDNNYGNGKLKAPAFGNSTSAYKDVANFYSFWSSYSTRKTFAWKDTFKTNEMEHRDERRAAERMNQKERSNAKREYNRNLQAAVTHVKRKDPRVAAEVERLEALAEEKEKQRAEEQAAAMKLRREKEKQWAAEAAAEEAERLKNAKCQTAEEAELARLEKDGSLLDQLYEMEAKAKAKQAAAEADEDEDEPKEIYRCDIFKKNFKTAAQYNQHINSNKCKAKVKKMKESGELPKDWSHEAAHAERNGLNNKDSKKGGGDGNNSNAAASAAANDSNTKKKVTKKNGKNDDDEEDDSDAESSSSSEEDWRTAGKKKKDKKKKPKKNVRQEKLFNHYDATGSRKQNAMEKQMEEKGKGKPAKKGGKGGDDDGEDASPAAPQESNTSKKKQKKNAKKNKNNNNADSDDDGGGGGGKRRGQNTLQPMVSDSD